MTARGLLGIHEQALLLHARRMDVLATNLANADTPRFKARDFDFAATLTQAATLAGDLTRTDSQHLPTSAPGATNLAYRVPFQPARDGNTVETDLELSRFAANAVAYQASLLFVNSRIATLRTAITGGR